MENAQTIPEWRTTADEIWAMMKETDRWKYRGAAAGVVFDDSEKTYALKKGFYVIEPSGDTFNIISPTGGYYPREW